MQTKNLKSFYVWYIITCHLTAYRASRNRFSAIRLHDYLHYCGIFLAHFLMKIDRNIISSLHIVFSLCTRVWCLYRFHQHNKNRWKCRCKREYHKVYNMRNIWETIDSFPRGPYYHLFKRYVFICWQNCGPRPKLFLRLDSFSTLVDHIILTYLRKSFIPDNKIK